MAYILLVDDEPFIINAFSRFLRRYGHQILGAPNGIEALKAVNENGPFDLIISDTNMPQMDGPSFVRALRAQQNTTPVVMNSAKGVQPEVQALLDANEVQGFFDKPLTNHQTLVDLVAAHVK